jgi:hypothetical protein
MAERIAQCFDDVEMILYKRFVLRTETENLLRNIDALLGEFHKELLLRP